MNKLATRLRIGEKIGIGFGAVGLIFLGVIWYYHLNLDAVVKDYRELHAVYGERQSRAFAIESRLTGMLSAAERFLLTRDTGYADRARREATALMEQTSLLSDIDVASQRTAEQLETLSNDFSTRFDAIVDAWRVRGLDEDSGLQGAFRDAVHQLEDRAGQYNVDRPYLLLLQIRRREKDLGLRRDPQYQQQVHALLEEMTATVSNSELPPPVKESLEQELSTYRTELDTYAGIVLAGDEISGGKGPFRDAAHRVEALLEAQYVPDLENQILQLRRREKDYLLRGDDRYVAMVDDIATGIRGQITASSIADAEQAELSALLDGYQRDFHALVDQDRGIAKLTEEMYAAAAPITPLVEANLAAANELMQQMSAAIADSAAARGRASLIAAALATALGALFAILITTGIVRPVRRMAGLLDRLTRENPSERMPTDPAGRDEINAMAAALNTMADHKSRFSKWWRSSMQEAIALRDRNTATNPDEREDADYELRRAVLSKLSQINAVKARLLDQTERIDGVADRLDEGESKPDDRADLRNAAAGIRTLIGIVDED
ncbi:MAG: HAMP domain-containing protein [Thiohalocapsa sp.]